LAAALGARLRELKQQLAAARPKRVLYVVWQEPLISIGQQTFLADALRRAGAESAVETTQDWPRLNLEEVIRRQPEYLVFASSHAETAGPTVEALRAQPGWRHLEAVEQGRVVVISDAVSRPAPRLVDAIEQLARQLHPEAFTEQPENRKEKIENRRHAAKPSFLFSDSEFLFLVR
jgi:iron complex transport system substrate-binding protein